MTTELPPWMTTELPPWADSRDTVVRTTAGVIEGTAEDGVRVFTGVPFAAPPVGDRRWKPPEPVPPWRGVKKTQAFAASPIQDPAMAAIVGALPPFSEDCLYLNIWTPAQHPGEMLAVMVWIHGGAFLYGSTSQAVFDGAGLASRGVVVVSVGHRLGPLGFLAHPELTREGNDRSGNYGLLDQIAGLRWVRDNIAAFGGDPGNVTIFGESVGGIAVSMLAAAPPAKGLFHRAISQSGGSFGAPRFADEAGVTVMPLRVAEAQGERYLRSIGAGSIAAARALPATSLPVGEAHWWPVFDGTVLPGDQYDLYCAGRFNDTPVLIGTNSDEGAVFTQPGVTPEQFEAQIRAGFGEFADAVLAVYPHATAAEAFTAAKNIFRDSALAWHSWTWARLQSANGDHPAYMYYFDHRTPQSPDGASHAADLPYLFGTLGLPGLPSPRAQDEQLADRMQAYWIAFARTGNPNHGTLIHWPRFTTVRQMVLQLDSSPHVRDLPNSEQLKTLDQYFTWRRQQAREQHNLQRREA